MDVTPSVRMLACGLDVHKDLIVAAIAFRNPDTEPTYVTNSFTTFNSSIDDLLTWIKSYKCEHVLIESAGKYWIPIFNKFEDFISVQLTHPKYVKAIKGKKSDQNDAMRCAQLYLDDQVRTSFIPPKPIRELRTTSRLRTKLVQERTRFKNRYQNAMTCANITLACVLSDCFGKTGLAIMERIIEGPYDDADISKLVRGRARKNIPLILDAVHGCIITGHSRDHISRMASYLKVLNAQIDDVDKKLLELSQPYRHQIELLRTIPGVEFNSAVQIIAEIGVDMSVFESSKDLTSWAGLAPCNDESNGKKKNRHTLRAGVYLKPTLIQCIHTSVNSKRQPYFAYKYRRLCKRKPKSVAAVAVARMMLTSIYNMLANAEVFNPKDQAKIDEQKQKKTPRITESSAIAFLAELGYDVSTFRKADVLTETG